MANNVFTLLSIRGEQIKCMKERVTLVSLHLLTYSLIGNDTLNVCTYIYLLYIAHVFIHVNAIERN